ncbi:MAG: DUF4124 domain-containing protein [Burkholderiaceae bacterium]
MHRASRFYLALALATLIHAAPSSVGAQTLYKCKDDQGRITFSDRGCQLSRKEAAQREVPTIESLSQRNKGDVDRLTPDNVKALIQRANVAMNAGDYLTPCKMLAPELFFTATDESSTPPVTLSGGRTKLCAHLKKTAEMLRSQGLKTATTVDTITVKVDEDGQQGKASYTTTETISSRELPPITLRCTQEDEVGLFNGHILIKHSSATCTPEG